MKLVTFRLSLLFFCTCVKVYARQEERISMIAKLTETSHTIYTKEVLQIFSSNVPNLSKIRFVANSSEKLKISLYSTEQSFGLLSNTQETNKIFSITATPNSQNICEIDFPDSVQISINRKYILKIQSDVLFYAYIEKSNNANFILYSEKEILPKERLNFEIIGYYKNKTPIKSSIQELIYLYRNTLVETKDIDSAKIQFTGLVFRSHFTFLKEMILRNISTNAGSAILYEFDIRGQIPVFATVFAEKIKLEKDSLQDIRISFHTAIYLDPNKYYCLIFEKENILKFNHPIARDSTQIIFPVSQKHIHIISELSGYDYYPFKIKDETIKAVNDKSGMRVTYKPKIRYLAKIVIRKPLAYSGLLKISKKDSISKSVLYKVPFTTTSLSYAEITLGPAIPLDVMREYHIEIEYDQNNMAKINDTLKTHVSSLILYGVLKFKTSLDHIYATQVRNEGDQLEARLKILSSNNINWIKIALDEIPFSTYTATIESFNQKVKKNQMGVILDFNISQYSTEFKFAEFKKWIQEFTRKHPTGKFIYNFGNYDADENNYSLIKDRTDELVGMLKTIEENLVFSETVPKIIISNAEVQKIFKQHSQQFDIFLLKNSYSDELTKNYINIVNDAFSKNDSITLPQIIYDFSELRERSMTNGFDNKIYDNYLHETKTVSGKTFNISMSLTDTLFNSSELILKVKVKNIHSTSPLKCIFNIISSDTICKEIILNSTDSIISCPFKIQHSFYKDQILTLNLIFSNQVQLYLIKTDKANEQTLIDEKKIEKNYVPCMYIGYNTIFKNKSAAHCIIKAKKFGQTFLSTGTQLIGIIIKKSNLKQSYSLSIYEFGNHKNPKGNALISGVWQSSKIMIKNYDFYDINLPNITKGKMYYVEFVSENLLEIHVISNLDQSLKNSPTFYTGSSGGFYNISESKSLPIEFITSYIRKDGTMHLPTINDKPNSEYLHFAEQYNTHLAENLVLGRKENLTLGYIFSKDIESKNQWGDFNNHGLLNYTYNVSLTKPEIKQYLISCKKIISFLGSDASTYKISIKMDKDGYDYLISYSAENNEYKAIIWNSNTENILNMGDDIMIKIESELEIQNLTIANQENSVLLNFDSRYSYPIKINNSPVYITFKLKAK